jgi:hypothetical protein
MLHHIAPYIAIHLSTQSVIVNTGCGKHVIIFVSDKCFGLYDTNQTRLEGNTTIGRKGQAQMSL